MCRVSRVLWSRLVGTSDDVALLTITAIEALSPGPAWFALVFYVTNLPSTVIVIEQLELRRYVARLIAPVDPEQRNWWALLSCPALAFITTRMLSPILGIQKSLTGVLCKTEAATAIAGCLFHLKPRRTKTVRVTSRFSKTRRFTATEAR
ncbi:hypothetical protein SCUP234_00806 [Seiridium cupressi]